MTALFLSPDTNPGTFQAGAASFNTHTEQIVSLERVTMKKSGNYLDGAPYILPLDKPFFIIKLNLLNDTRLFSRTSRGLTDGALLDLEQAVLRILGAPPFSWTISFEGDSDFPPSGFDDGSAVQTISFPYRGGVWRSRGHLQHRPFQVIDNLKYKHGGSLSTGWSHSLTLHVLPIAGDFPV